MRYVKARKEQKTLEEAYRIYVTDCLKLMSENTARYAGGSNVSVRYYDLIKKPVVETRTSEEIIDGIKAKLKAMGDDT